MLSHTTKLAIVRARALRSLIPPPRLKLSEWIEREIVLPEGVSALPGRVRLWPYQKEIADAISDPEIERISLVKPVRVGFTTLLSGAIVGLTRPIPQDHPRGRGEDVGKTCRDRSPEDHPRAREKTVADAKARPCTPDHPRGRGEESALRSSMTW
jgi:hypothetical protein